MPLAAHHAKAAKISSTAARSPTIAPMRLAWEDFTLAAMASKASRHDAG